MRASDLGQPRHRPRRCCPQERGCKSSPSPEVRGHGSGVGEGWGESACVVVDGVEAKEHDATRSIDSSPGGDRRQRVARPMRWAGSVVSSSIGVGLAGGRRMNGRSATRYESSAIGIVSNKAIGPKKQGQRPIPEVEAVGAPADRRQPSQSRQSARDDG